MMLRAIALGIFVPFSVPASQDDLPATASINQKESETNSMLPVRTHSAVSSIM